MREQDVLNFICRCQIVEFSGGRCDSVMEAANLRVVLISTRLVVGSVIFNIVGVIVERFVILATIL